MKRCDFVDWMKALGMFLIVFGHFFGEPYNQFTQPIYPKQLGVALFVFVMGWGLGNESRPRWQVAYTRLFSMYFWGLIIALIFSIVALLFINELKLSNYMPLVFGINVIFNFFPANPTTWFIGTYLHIILLWALLLYRIQITPSLLALSLLFEISFRAALIEHDQLFVAYMSLPNWLTVFLFGMYMRGMKDSSKIHHLSYLILAWVLFTSTWAVALNSLGLNGRFPFRALQIFDSKVNSTITSALISTLYLVQTWFFVAIFSRIKATSLIRFFARNTVIVFIGHMPFYVIAAPIASIFIPSGWGKRLLIVLIMFVGLSLLSELLSKIISLDKLREESWKIFARKQG